MVYVPLDARMVYLQIAVILLEKALKVVDLAHASAKVWEVI
jgi:hypothetical protein